MAIRALAVDFLFEGPLEKAGLLFSVLPLSHLLRRLAVPLRLSISVVHTEYSHMHLLRLSVNPARARQILDVRSRHRH